MIQLHNLCVSYQKDASALSEITLSIGRGEFVYLTGPSGAGKTTLLKLLYAGLHPDRGQVLIDGQNISMLRKSQVPYLRRSIGVVFQDFKLLPGRTVLENVAISLEVLGWGRRDIGKKVYHVLKQVGLEHKIHSTPLRLSGGEQQRVALARALVTDPKLILADEPTGNLDEENKRQVMTILREANMKGATVVVATHDPRLMDYHHGRIVELESGTVKERQDAGGN